ncbi:MAG: hypothetical protein FWE32_02390 [Oscillospiraceae bacterium]|nr:hypothetical protein [Oscillospiraceae bacterium]
MSKLHLIDAVFDNYIQSIDNLKKQSRKTISNCIVSVDKIKDTMLIKDCILYVNDVCIFLAIPEHEMYYQIYYHITELNVLSENLSLLSFEFAPDLPLVCAVSGAKKDIDLYVSRFELSGFTLRRRMRRFAYLRSKKNDFSGYDGNNRSEFASPDAAEEILKILTSHFDVYTQAIPEISEIMEHAKKKQIPIIKIDGKIAALLYYELHGNILHSIFEVVVEEHRGKMFNIELMAHRDDHLKDKKIKLMYGWRDMDNERLIKLGEFYAKRWGTYPGDRVTYTFFQK